ncbi:hypothetical protein L9F63_016758, partial [Diploptera punctata]
MAILETYTLPKSKEFQNLAKNPVNFLRKGLLVILKTNFCSMSMELFYKTNYFLLLRVIRLMFLCSPLHSCFRG